MSARAVAVALLVAAPLHAAPSLWEALAQPHHKRCLQLLENATRLRASGESAMSLPMLRGAVELCPNDREVLQAAGEALLSARLFAEARRALERARLFADESPLPRERELSLLRYLGVARELTGDLDGAIEQHRRLEALGGLPPPNQPVVHHELGDELMATGRLADAIDEYRRAVALAPDRPLVRLALAVALDRDEQVDRARAETAIVLTLDSQLRRLASDEYVFVPAADVHYYRALALTERGALGEARLSLRKFLDELPSGPYAAHARRRLAAAETRVDPRELEADPAVDKRLIARALGPVVAALEDCLPAGRVQRLRFSLARGALHADPHHPVATCLDRTLAGVAAPRTSGAVVVPLAGRSGATSQE